MAWLVGEVIALWVKRGLEVEPVVVLYSGIDGVVFGLLVGKESRDAFVCETGSDVTCGA